MELTSTTITKCMTTLSHSITDNLCSISIISLIRNRRLVAAWRACTSVHTKLVIFNIYIHCSFSILRMEKCERFMLLTDIYLVVFLLVFYCNFKFFNQLTTVHHQNYGVELNDKLNETCDKYHMSITRSFTHDQLLFSLDHWLFRLYSHRSAVQLECPT